MSMLEVIIFFIPAGIGNMAPVLAVRIPLFNRLAYPIDHGATWKGIRIFGDHKTYRGYVSGILLGSLSAVALHKLGIFGDTITTTAVMGAVLGFGALLGDSIKSFFKRRAHVPSGKAWFPFDQLDYIVGGLICIAPWQLFNAAQIGVITVTYFCLHILSTNIGFLLGLKKDRI